MSRIATRPRNAIAFATLAPLWRPLMLALALGIIIGEINPRMAALEIDLRSHPAIIASLVPFATTESPTTSRLNSSLV